MTILVKVTPNFDRGQALPITDITAPSTEITSPIKIIPAPDRLESSPIGAGPSATKTPDGIRLQCEMAHWHNSASAET
ncbi:hypothetical protein OUZ56_027139 [Daphnia magna]|uniref:Uncharacterized protein n=1 Tax=Daphnia magna TaxID=35525 RepID=A0ABQ9ZPK7_9CRUS|nr:hypothetical protein OUZ56_027139 [Daphnia magna]